jgi:hypothetical protein
MYFMRAKTEERHLSRDPIYVKYALWMNEHGALRLLNRVPIFKYKVPADLSPIVPDRAAEAAPETTAPAR